MLAKIQPTLVPCEDFQGEKITPKKQNEISPQE